MTVFSVSIVALNLITLAGLGLCFIKLRARREEDPRLSYGLKLLQNKIAIIEDLSDRTDLQVKQLVTLMEAKLKDLQGKIQDSQSQLKAIDQAMERTLEVAQVFQEQIPHETFVERKVSNKYINAARLAHQGMPMEEIRRQVDLPPAELELIVKLNKEQLMFAEDQLPAWVDKHPLQDNDKIFQVPQVDMGALEKLGADFKKACLAFEEKNQKTNTPAIFEDEEATVTPYKFKSLNDTLYK